MHMLRYMSHSRSSSPTAHMVGASAGIFGILAAAYVISPDTTLLLIFSPNPVKLRTLILVFLGISVVTILMNGKNAGGEAAHLGGAICGFFLISHANLLNFALLGS